MQGSLHHDSRLYTMRYGFDSFDDFWSIGTGGSAYHSGVNCGAAQVSLSTTAIAAMERACTQLGETIEARTASVIPCLRRSAVETLYRPLPQAQLSYEVELLRHRCRAASAYLAILDQGILPGDPDLHPDSYFSRCDATFSSSRAGSGSAKNMGVEPPTTASVAEEGSDLLLRRAKAMEALWEGLDPDAAHAGGGPGAVTSASQAPLAILQQPAGEGLAKEVGQPTASRSRKRSSVGLEAALELPVSMAALGEPYAELEPRRALPFDGWILETDSAAAAIADAPDPQVRALSSAYRCPRRASTFYSIVESRCRGRGSDDAAEGLWLRAFPSADLPDWSNFLTEEGLRAVQGKD